MNRESIKLLLIEDDPGDVRLVREMLANSAAVQFDLKHAASLSAGMAMLSDDTIHLILLDFKLPDSQGMDTIQILRKAVTDVPVIVLTGLDDEVFGIKLLQMGAQDYLVKGKIDNQTLHRSIRYAIERQNLWIQLEQERQKSADAREIQSLERIRGFQIPSATAQLMGEVSLSKSLPEIFKEIADSYGTLLDRAVEGRFYKVTYNIPEETRALADKLGFLKACPRDVVEIHTAVIKSKISGMTSQKASMYNVEARMVILEVMGDLASYYRTYALGK